MITSLTPITLPPPESGVPRSEGIHVSSVIRAIAAESGILKKEYAESLDLIDVGQEAWWERLDPVSKIRISMGMAWDEWYLPNLRTVVPHPGEMHLDGIYMTPDGESIDFIRVGRISTSVVAIHEVKVTYKSTNTVKDLQDQWMWHAQMKSYCKGASTTLAFLHVLFVCGDYSYPIRPRIGPLEYKPTCWRIQYTQDEIDEQWDLNTGYVEHRRQLELEEES